MLSDKPSRIYRKCRTTAGLLHALRYSPETTERSFQKAKQQLSLSSALQLGQYKKDQGICITQYTFLDTVSGFPIRVHDAGGKIIETHQRTLGEVEQC
jgi:hypothetical protein